MEKNVLEFLENSQRMYGEKTACADMNNELTYTQLMNQAKFIGSCLSLKIKPTQGVPVYMDKTCNTLSLFMGIVYAGGYYCMLDTTHPAERINLILDTIQARKQKSSDSRARLLILTNYLKNTMDRLWIQRLRKDWGR